MPPPNGGRTAALALGLLSSLPGSALELHLDDGAWRVPAFHLPAPAPLHGLESWQLNGAFQSNQSSNSLALISIAGAAPLAVRPGELIVEVKAGEQNQFTIEVSAGKGASTEEE